VTGLLWQADRKRRSATFLILQDKELGGKVRILEAVIMAPEPSVGGVLGVNKHAVGHSSPWRLWDGRWLCG
jgi:hypothetical protein